MVVIINSTLKALVLTSVGTFGANPPKQVLLHRPDGAEPALKAGGPGLFPYLRFDEGDCLSGLHVDRFRATTTAGMQRGAKMADPLV